MEGAPGTFTGALLIPTPSPTSPGVHSEKIGSGKPPTDTVNVTVGRVLGGFVKAVATLLVS